MSTYDNASSISNIYSIAYSNNCSVSNDILANSIYSIEEPKGSYASHVDVLECIKKY